MILLRSKSWRPQNNSLNCINDANMYIQNKTYAPLPYAPKTQTRHMTSSNMYTFACQFMHNTSTRMQETNKFEFRLTLCLKRTRLNIRTHTHTNNPKLNTSASCLPPHALLSKTGHKPRQTTQPIPSPTFSLLDLNSIFLCSLAHDIVPNFIIKFAQSS